MQQTVPSERAIRFTGKSFMAFVLAPTPPIADWLAEFDAFAARSPGFFVGRPVVVDIAAMPPTRPELIHLMTELKRRNISIMGLDGRSPGELGADARGLPPILTGGRDTAVDVPAEEAGSEVSDAILAAVEEAIDAPDPQTLILDEPVRSGVSVVHLEGDVVVVGAVASGAEVVASGSIHVYGALRGRAIAGSAGNRNARIFARSLDAELVAIDGLYKTAEDLPADAVEQPVQVFLDGEALKIAAINKGN